MRKFFLALLGLSLVSLGYGQGSSMDMSHIGKLTKGTNTVNAARFHMSPKRDRNVMSAIILGTTTTAKDLRTVDMAKKGQINKLIGRGAFTSGGASSLLTSLRFYYPLDEVSGSRFDFSGNVLTLTDNNTVTSTTGKVGTAASFAAASNEALSRTSEANLEFGDVDYTISSWIKLTTTNETTFCWGSSVGGGGEIDYEMGYFKNSGFFTWEYYDNGTAQYYNVIDNSTPNPALNTWYHVLCSYKAAGNIMSIQVNNSAIKSTTNAVAQAVHPGGVFTIGCARGLGGANDHNGAIDEVGGWNRLLTDQEKTTLYNGGNGVTYPTFAP